MLSAKKGLNLNSTDPKTVVAYFAGKEVFPAQIFESKEKIARFLNVPTRTVTSSL
jgi:hypothetical protein